MPQHTPESLLELSQYGLTIFHLSHQRLLESESTLDGALLRFEQVLDLAIAMAQELSKSVQKMADEDVQEFALSDRRDVIYSKLAALSEATDPTNWI